MPIAVDCSCGRAFKVKDELAGNRIRCPDCKTVLTVPEQEAEFELEIVEEYTSKSTPTAKPQSQPIRAQLSRYENQYDDEGEEEVVAVRAKSSNDEAAKARRARKRKVSRESERSSSGFSGISINKSIITGLLMMVGAVVWFVVALVFTDRIFLYPPVMFVFGIGAIIRGFRGED